MDTSYFPIDIIHNNATTTTATPARNITFNDVVNSNESKLHTSDNNNIFTPIRTISKLVQLVHQETPYSKVEAILDMLCRNGYVQSSTSTSPSHNMIGIPSDSLLSDLCHEYFNNTLQSPISITTNGALPISGSNSLSPIPSSSLSTSKISINRTPDDSLNEVNQIDSNGNNIYHDTKATTSKSKDSRLQGDFTVWNNSNNMRCSVLGIKERYVGLYDTMLSHNVEDGILIPAVYNSSGNNSGKYNKENNSSHSLSNSNGSSNGTSLHNKYISALHNNNGPMMLTGDESNVGYYITHLLECIIRPDILLTNITTSIIKVAKINDFKINTSQRSHIILSIPKSRQRTSFETIKASMLNTISSDGSTPAVSSKNAITNKEFDMMDIQVCISREVRQRVLLIQFFKKVPTLKTTIGGLLVNNMISGNSIIEPKSLKQCPITKSIITQIKVRDFYSLASKDFIVYHLYL